MRGECYLTKTSMESYEFDCRGLAQREIRGFDITSKIVQWSILHHVTPEEMRARINNMKATWKPDAVRYLNKLKADKEKGKETVYKFELGGKLTIDEAIRIMEERLPRY